MRSSLGVVLLLGLATVARAQPEVAPEEQQPPPSAQPPSAHAHAHALGMPRTAFVFESRFAGAFNLSGGFGGTAAIIPGFMIGARLIDRLHLGVEFFLTNTTTAGVGGGPSNGTTAFTLGPTAEIDILKVAANRVAFYGKLGFGFGAAVLSGGFSPNIFLLRFDLGLGIRYAPVPYFAIGMESGFINLFFSPDKPGTFSLTSLYGGLVGTFMYGH
ncbi:MAG TPA: hypothetical protein VFF06_32230 [Polyangia bacterium]|nr:hypothetical protein [Polyangia bacterium]